MAIRSIVVVPGLGGSGPTHWQTYLQRSLVGVTRVEQDDWERPDLTAWMDRLADAIAERPGAVVVAHSLACPLVAHLALRHPRMPVAAALLVAPADVDSEQHTPRHTHGFGPIPLDTLPFPSIVVASTNDPYISIGRAYDLARAWDADFINVGACGHINVESGFGPWPAAAQMVNSLIASADARSDAIRRRLRSGVAAR